MGVNPEKLVRLYMLFFAARTSVSVHNSPRARAQALGSWCGCQCVQQLPSRPARPAGTREVHCTGELASIKVEVRQRKCRRSCFQNRQLCSLHAHARARRRPGQPQLRHAAAGPAQLTVTPPTPHCTLHRTQARAR